MRLAGWAGAVLGSTALCKTLYGLSINQSKQKPAGGYRQASEQSEGYEHKQGEYGGEYEKYEHKQNSITSVFLGSRLLNPGE